MPKILKSTDKDYVELELQLVWETGGAYKVSDGIVTEWVPVSQVEDFEHLDNGMVRIIIPEWLAQAKGFI